VTEYTGNATEINRCGNELSFL